MKEYKNGIWTPSEPEEGERVLIFDAAGGSREETYKKEVKPNKIVITSHNKRAVTDMGESLTVTSEMQDSEGNKLPFNGSFAMPVGRVGGLNYRTLMMNFIGGICSKTAQWNDAGEFEITKEMINMHLDEPEKLDFDGFNISVAE